MLQRLLFTFILFLSSWTALFSQASLSGKVTDADNEPAPFANVALYKNGVLKTGTATDFDGYYRFTNLEAGTYDVEATLVGYQPQRISGVLIKGSQNVPLDLQLGKGVVLDAVEIKQYKVPIVEADNTVQGKTLTSQEIAKLPIKDVNSLVASTAGVASVDGGEINIKGSRANGTDYYIDGIRVRGQTVPVNEIEQLQVVTGGIEAKYGDVTGGIISITTKGPASKLTGGAELETSKYLDNFGYAFANMNLSGPLWKRKGESVIGFRFSGQVIDKKDNNPSAIPLFRVKNEVRKQLEENPIAYIGNAGTPVAAAELLTADKFDQLPIRPNNTFRQYDFTGKLDFKLNKSSTLTIGGNLYNLADQLTVPTWQVFNAQNNPTVENQRYRTNVRFRQRLGNESNSNDTSKSKKSGIVIENAAYSLQLGIEKNQTKVQDPTHQDRFFDYGYIGKFDYQWSPVFNDTGHIGNLRRLVNYEAANINPVLANYNKGVEVDATGTNINVFNGLYNRGNLASVYNFHTNIGSVYNAYSVQSQDLVTGLANFNFDLLPNGSKKAAHNIEFGLLYEQRNERSYTLAPFALWDLAEQSQNRHLAGGGSSLDRNNIIGDTIINGAFFNIYGLLADANVSPDIQFYKRLREKTGQPLLSYGNVNNLTPDQLSLDMFSAFELISDNIVSYYGYDYLGKKLNSKVAFNDFFSATDANGVRTFPVAAFQPIYTAGYIQDKFTFKDAIFNIGVRIDRFDANNKVLKDPYSLYDIMNAEDFYTKVAKTQKPSNIGSDYKVYITGERSTTALAYRKGDQWYDAQGNPADPITIFGQGGKVTPQYNVADPARNNPTSIKDRQFQPDGSFADYTPQVNIMPRLAFSFPISDAANFFAHYDVLVARPPAGNIVTALDYFRFDDVGQTTLNNAALKPEKTIDYEVGFQQKLTSSSGLKIAAYYKELRDLIQLRRYKFLAGSVTEYESLSNLDFGTVKGFTFQYDLRRTNNFSAQANYTLQFANGTGSDPTSQRSLNRQGNIRTLSPLDFDERHRIVLNLDYRYDNGKAYNGPTFKGKQILSDFGINIQTTAVSGRPYTARNQPIPFGGTQIKGSINGSRLPFTYNVDLRIDKNFSLSKDPQKDLNLNIYFRVQNLLDTRNISDVYSATGSATDDGYLTSERGQNDLANTLRDRPNDLNAYRHSYLMNLLNPNFYYLPRRIFVGAIVGF